MALAYQRDSYLQTLTTRVKSCDQSKKSTLIGGKKVKGYEVVLEDTVLFPEGGGQPDDHGKINDIDVVQVMRHGVTAVHLVTDAVSVDTDVTVTVDWERRWDNMQQHSGQHLITAMAERMFGYKTTSWNLGLQTAFIELATDSLTTGQMSLLEAEVNKMIRQSLPVTTTVYTDKSDPELLEAHTRGLPDDHEGPVRVVSIQGLDANMCCGTHVSNISHLQVIKLLTVEKGKKGKQNLVFVVGDRVLGYLGRCYSQEKSFTTLLGGCPEEHLQLVEKLQKSYKVANKNATTLLRDVAALECDKFKAKTNRDPLFVLHRREGDNEFMNSIVQRLAEEEVLLFLTTGDDKGAGTFMLAGREETVGELGPRIAEILDGKGGGKKGRFQGKASKLSRRAEAEKLLWDYISMHKDTEQ
ncbi:Alanyl-tRNA editing protein Aarsd1-A [Lamellibrachia satsuma]|nr:Alanyl-tRNA editing protein Aarsd1-A [Lamellibrachia satsuma]